MFSNVIVMFRYGYPLALYFWDLRFYKFYQLNLQSLPQ